MSTGSSYLYAFVSYITAVHCDAGADEDVVFYNISEEFPGNFIAIRVELQFSTNIFAPILMASLVGPGSGFPAGEFAAISAQGGAFCIHFCPNDR